MYDQRSGSHSRFFGGDCAVTAFYRTGEDEEIFSRPPRETNNMISHVSEEKLALYGGAVCGSNSADGAAGTDTSPCQAHAACSWNSKCVPDCESGRTGVDQDDDHGPERGHPVANQ